jgi:hypothetical protein
MKIAQSGKYGILAVLVIGAFCLAACGESRINQTNFEKIQTGMSLAQVQAILGEPTEASSMDLAVFSGTASKWRQGDVTITIQFVNGKVVAKQFSKTKE